MTETQCRCEPTCQVPYGRCHCGCGRETRIAPQTAFDRGWVKGEPIRYIRGHANQERRDRHLLTEFNELSRRAVCSRCGPVTVKLNGSTGWKCTGRINTEHRLSDIDLEGKEAWCRGCDARVEILLKKAGRWACKVAVRGHQLKDRTDNAERRKESFDRWYKENWRAHHLRTKFGITEADYDAMLEAQGGACAICDGPPRGSGKRGGFFHIDHCHNSGAIRGLLCGPCNSAIGLLGDDEERILRALDYLRKARQLDD